jgi:probable phosphoglycerate mutase
VLGQRVRIDKGLLECDFGEWTGADLKALMKLPEWATVQRAPSTFRFPEGESFIEMQTRMVSTLDRLRAAHPGATIVCVSHADPIKAAVAHAMGTHIDLFQRIVISTCSITAIAYTAGGPTVLTVNSTGGSLAELRPS